MRSSPLPVAGPEPTTDRFVVVYGGADERRTPGNTLAVQPDKPYQVRRQAGMRSRGGKERLAAELAECGKLCAPEQTKPCRTGYTH